MNTHRNRHSAEFKAKVAMVALSEAKPLAELSSEYRIHQTQITRWKHELIANAAELSRKGKKKSPQPRSRSSHIIEG